MAAGPGFSGWSRLRARLSRRVGGVPRALVVSFLAVAAVGAGRPGARPWSRVKAPVIRVAQGQRAAMRSRRRRPPRGGAPGSGEDPQPQAFGFPSAGLAGKGEHLRPDPEFAGYGNE